MSFSPELESKLEEGYAITMNDDTVVFILDDMYEINERFQAVLDWFKGKGNKMRRRFGPGCYLQRGMLYFVGADTHRQTRGVQAEIDLRPHQEELVRQVGLEARLREKGLA